MHFIGERSLSLYLSPERMRFPLPDLVKKTLTALTRSMEYGRSSVYALMILLNLEVRLNRPRANGNI